MACSEVFAIIRDTHKGFSAATNHFFLIHTKDQKGLVLVSYNIELLYFSYEAMLGFLLMTQNKCRKY